MDDDIRAELKEVGKWLRDVGNMVGSTKSNMESITAMRNCLVDGQTILETYLRIQIERYEEAL